MVRGPRSRRGYRAAHPRRSGARSRGRARPVKLPCPDAADNRHPPPGPRPVTRVSRRARRARRVAPFASRSRADGAARRHPRAAVRVFRAPETTATPSRSPAPALRAWKRWSRTSPSPAGARWSWSPATSATGCATMLTRYGADGRRARRRVGPRRRSGRRERALAASRADIVAVVHAETSTGVRNPVAEIAELAREHDALGIVDAVTSLGAMPLDVDAWGIDAVYSCSQKGLGAPSGLAPVVFSPRALDRRVDVPQLLPRSRAARGLLGAAQVSPHDLRAAHLRACTRRSPRSKTRTRRALGAARARAPRARGRARADGAVAAAARRDRLWSLNAVRVPDGVDEAAVRSHLLSAHNIEIGAGLGPLAGKIWRVGLMGSGATLTTWTRDRLWRACSRAALLRG